MVANCLRSAGVSAYDTRDAVERHRLVFIYVTICLHCIIAYVCYLCILWRVYM